MNKKVYMIDISKEKKNHWEIKQGLLTNDEWKAISVKQNNIWELSEFSAAFNNTMETVLGLYIRIL